MGSIVYNTYRPKMINNNLVDGTTWTQYLQQIPESEVARIYPGYEAAKNRLDTSTPNNLNILNVSGFFLSDGSPLNDELQYQIELEVSASTAHRYFNIIWYNPDTDSFVNTTATSSNGFDMLSYHQSFKTYTPPVVDDKLHYLDNLGLQRFKANIDENLNEIKRTPVTTSGTGAAYVAQVKGINAANIYMVPVGTSFTMIPHTDSTTVKPTLNVNGLGAREIRVKSMVNNDAAIPTEDKFLLRDKPVDVMFDGTYWVCDMTVVDSRMLSDKLGVDEAIKKAEDAANVASSAEVKADSTELGLVKIGNDLPVMIRSGLSTAEIIDNINDIAFTLNFHSMQEIASIFNIPIDDFDPSSCFCYVENADVEAFAGLMNTLSGASNVDNSMLIATDIMMTGYISDVLVVKYTYIYIAPKKRTFVVYLPEAGRLEFYNRTVSRLPFAGEENQQGYTIGEVIEFNENTDYGENIPWLHLSKDIMNVYIIDKISPSSTAYWFAGFNMLQRIDSLNNIDTSNVTDMNHMFNNAGSMQLGLDINQLNYLDTSCVTNMHSMFSYAHISGDTALTIDTSNVTDMSSMFNNARLPHYFYPKFNTSNVTDMSSMFNRTNGCIELNISSFETSSVINMDKMFNMSIGGGMPDSKLFGFIHINTSNKFITNNVVNSDYMFCENYDLTGGKGTIYNHSYIDKTYARIDNAPTSPGYFVQTPSVVTLAEEPYMEFVSSLDKNGNDIDIYMRPNTSDVYLNKKHYFIENIDRYIREFGLDASDVVFVVDITGMYAPIDTEFPVTATFRFVGLVPEMFVLACGFNDDIKDFEFIETKSGEGTVTVVAHTNYITNMV